MTRKNAQKDDRKLPLVVLREEELSHAAGGAMLMSAVSAVMKSIGGALQNAARAA